MSNARTAGGAGTEAEGVTCPIQPVPLKLLPIVALEDLVDADDVASVFSGWSLVGRVNGWPGDRGNLGREGDCILIEW